MCVEVPCEVCAKVQVQFLQVVVKSHLHHWSGRSFPDYIGRSDLHCVHFHDNTFLVLRVSSCLFALGLSKCLLNCLCMYLAKHYSIQEGCTSSNSEGSHLTSSSHTRSGWKIIPRYHGDGKHGLTRPVREL